MYSLPDENKYAVDFSHCCKTVNNAKLSKNEGNVFITTLTVLFRPLS